MYKPCSIIIPHYNQKEQLEKCLRALLKANELINDVIVVDNRSDQLPLSTCNTYGVKLLCTQSSGSPYVARNLGIRHACFDDIVLLDVNCEVKENCIQEGLKKIDFKSIVSAIPIYHRKSELDSWQRFDYLYSIIRDEDMAERKSLPMTNLYFKKRTYEQLGPFSEVRSLGDIAWTRKAYVSGYRLKVAEDAQFYYPFKRRKAFGAKYKRLGGGEVENGKVTNISLYFIKNMLPPSPDFVKRFLYLNEREKMELNLCQLIFFCWLVKVLYGIGSLSIKKQ